jgi:hypothetical protein
VLFFKTLILKNLVNESKRKEYTGFVLFIQIKMSIKMVTGSLDKNVNKNGDGFVRQKSGRRCPLLPPFLSDEPGTASDHEG